VAISTAVKELKQMDNDELLAEPLPAAPASRTALPAMPTANYARELYLVLTRHDEAGANELVQEAFAHFNLQTVLLQIFIPCLVEIGEAWSRGYIRVTTEHFASAYLRGRLLALLQTLPANRGASSIMVGGAPTEEHEIGALMMAVLLRSAGYRVEFLGADLPLDDLVDHARFEKPDLMILTATTRSAALELATLQEKLNPLRPAPLFGYGGSAFNADPDVRKNIPGVFLGETLSVAVEKVEELLGKKKS
jgi:methanogenic corrinoid protein MtbC1